MKKILIVSLSLIIVITQQSCKKDLNALPENSRVSDVAITNAKTAETALNGAYFTFANASGGVFFTTASTAIPRTDWTNHERYPAMYAGYLGYSLGHLDEEENRTDENGNLYWAEEYKLLNTVNGALQGVNSLSDNTFEGSRKNEILGELYFLRAYAHFKLLIFYGVWFDLGSPLGVLLRDELSTKSNILKSRSTVKESYDFILSDLDEAISKAPSLNEKYYATKWAAMVLKMRVLMSRGISGDYNEVVALANNIIDNSPYKLEPNIQNLFHTKGLASEEVILGLKPQENQEKDFYSRSKEYWAATSVLFVASQNLKGLLENDPREDWMIGTLSIFARFVPNTYYFTKYMIQGGTPTQLSETYYAIRLSEVYLLKAEAIARAGGSLTEAKTSVKEVMTCAGVTDFTAIDNANTVDDFLLQLYFETSKSLVAEDGQEWMALLRLDFTTVQQLRPSITSKAQYILPVPSEEFAYNPDFGNQNPGYSK